MLVLTLLSLPVASAEGAAPAESPSVTSSATPEPESLTGTISSTEIHTWDYGNGQHGKEETHVVEHVILDTHVPGR
jgi:hypothetical protein